MKRRDLIATGAAAMLMAGQGRAATVVKLPQAFFPQDVKVADDLAPGHIYVDTAGRFMYLAHGGGTARRYGIAVGAVGRNFQGTARVGRKAEWPSWTPTADMIAQEPDVYGPYRGGLPGGHRMNPLGARALYLHDGGRDTMYRIHGTPQPWTIGKGFSSGCIRTVNEWMVDLYDRVPVGTVVHVF